MHLSSAESYCLQFSALQREKQVPAKGLSLSIGFVLASGAVDFAARYDYGKQG